MIRLIAPLVLALLSLAPAQGTGPLTLADAQRFTVEASADVRAARATLAAAERDVERIERDPLSLRLDRLQARHAVQTAETALRTALARSRVDTASAYVDALEAEAALTLVLEQLDLAERTLEAQLARLEAGAITQLDAERARNDHEAAVRSALEAETSRALAFSELASRIGAPVVELTPLDVEHEELPPVEEILARTLEEHAQVLAAKRAVEVARVRLETVDNAFSSRVDVQNARDSLDAAEANLREVARSLDLTVRGTYNAAVAAAARLQNAEASLRTSQADLEAQRERFDAGSISLLALRQAEIGFMNARASYVGARHALHLAVLRLDTAITG